MPVPLVVNVGFKDVLTDGELTVMPAFCQHPVFIAFDTEHLSSP